MKPLAADGADVVAVSGRNWIRQAAGQAPGQPQLLAPPDKVTATAPTKVENIGGSDLAAVWDGPNGPVVAVYDAHTGGKVVESSFGTGTDFSQAATVREPGSERTALGRALFEPSRHSLGVLTPPYTPVALTPGHVFADDAGGGVVDLQISDGKVTVVRFTGQNPTVPVGILGTGSTSLAVVAAPYRSGWLLCALPRR
jgi:hypothetical protein